MATLNDFVRIDWKTRRVTRLSRELVNRESLPHVTASEDLWREMVDAGRQELEADIAMTSNEVVRQEKAETAPARIAALEHAARQTLARNGMRRLDVPITDAVRGIAAERDPHVYVPKTKGEPWIVRSAPDSVYGGKLYALYPGSDGKTTIARALDAEHGPTLESYARSEGLSTIEELVAKRLQQEAAASAPERADEDEESALARMRLRRAIVADKAATGGRGLLTGEVFQPPKEKYGDERRMQVLSDVHDRVAAEHKARSAQTQENNDQ